MDVATPSSRDLTSPLHLHLPFPPTHDFPDSCFSATSDTNKYFQWFPCMETAALLFVHSEESFVEQIRSLYKCLRIDANPRLVIAVVRGVPFHFESYDQCQWVNVHGSLCSTCGRSCLHFPLWGMIIASLYLSSDSIEPLVLWALSRPYSRCLLKASEHNQFSGSVWNHRTGNLPMHEVIGYLP